MVPIRYQFDVVSTSDKSIKLISQADMMDVYKIKKIIIVNYHTVYFSTIENYLLHL